MDRTSVSVILLAVTSVAWSQHAIAQEIVELEGIEKSDKYDIGSVLDSLREQTVASVSPGRSELARELGNGIQQLMFRRVWPKGKEVDAYIVHDSNNTIISIYPFPPEIISASQNPYYVFHTKLIGTGDWYVAREPTIGPPAVDNADRMKKWDNFMKHAANQRSQAQVRGLKEFVNKGEDGIKIKGPGFGMFAEYFDDKKIQTLQDLCQRLFTPDIYVDRKQLKATVESFARQQSAEQKARDKAEQKASDDEIRGGTVKWNYIKSILGLACSNPQAVSRLADAGKVVSANLRDNGSVVVHVAVNLAKTGELNSCQYALFKQIDFQRGVTTADLVVWAEQYRQEHPSLVKRFQTTVDDYLAALGKLLESMLDSLNAPSSSSSSGSSSSHYHSSSSEPDCFYDTHLHTTVCRVL